MSFRIPSRTLFNIYSPCFFSSSGLSSAYLRLLRFLFHTLVVSDDPDSSEEYLSVFCRLSLNGNLSAFLLAHMVKNLPEMWETWVPSLGWEDPLEKGMATHSGILA